MALREKPEFRLLIKCPPIGDDFADEDTSLATSSTERVILGVFHVIHSRKLILSCQSDTACLPASAGKSLI